MCLSRGVVGFSGKALRNGFHAGAGVFAISFFSLGRAESGAACGRTLSASRRLHGSSLHKSWLRAVCVELHGWHDLADRGIHRDCRHHGSPHCGRRGVPAARESAAGRSRAEDCGIGAAQGPSESAFSLQLPQRDPWPDLLGQGCGAGRRDLACTASEENIGPIQGSADSVFRGTGHHSRDSALGKNALRGGLGMERQRGCRYRWIFVAADAAATARGKRGEAWSG